MLTRALIFYLVTRLTGSPIAALAVLIGLYLAFDYQVTGFLRRGLATVRRGGEITELKRVVALNPHNAAALSDLGRLLVIGNKAREASDYLQRAYARLSDTAETTYYLGLAQLRCGQAAEGEALILKALQINPRFRYGEPVLRLAEYYAATGRSDAAGNFFERFFSIHASSVEGHYKCGLFRMRLGDASRAETHFQKAVAAFDLSQAFKKREERLWAYKARYRLWTI